MKQIVLALLLALSLAPVAPVLARRTGITLITSGISTGGPNGSSVTLTTTGANFCVANANYYSTPPTPAVTDSINGSSGWTALTAYAVGFSGNSEIWYNANMSSGNVGVNQVFTVAASSSYSVIGVACFSGVAASPFDVENGHTQSIAHTVAPGSITPNFNNELIFTTAGWTGGEDPMSISGGGFSVVTADTDYGPGNNMGSGFSYIVQGTAGASSPTWTGSGSGFMTSAAIASFKESGGAGPTFPNAIIGMAPIKCCKGVR